MDANTWKECLRVYKPYFYDWCKGKYNLGELNASEFWRLFKHWFYDIRTDSKGRRITLKEAQKNE